MSIASEIQRLQQVRSNLYEAIVSKGVTPVSPTFEDCANAVYSIGSTLETTTIPMWWVGGRSTAVGYYVRVGHQGEFLNNDGVWQFTPTENCSSISFMFRWDNLNAQTGWKGAYEYVFAISNDSSDGMTAYSEPHIAKEVVTLSGHTGTVNVEFSNVSLQAGVTYYVRVNQNGDTFSTLKAFWQGDNEAVITKVASGGGGNYVVASTFSEMDMYNATAGTIYQYRGRLLFFDGNTWQVYYNGELIGSISNDSEARNRIYGSGTQFMFDAQPDAGTSISMPLYFISGPAMTYNSLSMNGTMPPQLFYGSTVAWSQGTWVKQEMTGGYVINYQSISLSTPPFGTDLNFTMEHYIWLICNGTYTKKTTPTVLTTTFDVTSGATEFTVSFPLNSNNNAMTPDSFVATIVGAGSTNSVCSLVAIGTTTATYTRTTSGTATSQAGTNTVTYASQKITIPNRTSDNASRNLKVGTWRIVAWNSKAVLESEASITEELNAAGGTTLIIN